MNKRQVQQQINRTAKATRKHVKETQPDGDPAIEINYGIPYVAVNTAVDEYFFQGEEASNLIDEATTTANKFDTSVENVILHQAASW